MTPTTCPTCGHKVELYKVPEINALRCPDCFHHVDQAAPDTKKATPQSKTT